jgi:hypothetical protein
MMENINAHGAFAEYRFHINILTGKSLHAAACAESTSRTWFE